MCLTFPTCFSSTSGATIDYHCFKVLRKLTFPRICLLMHSRCRSLPICAEQRGSWCYNFVPHIWLHGNIYWLCKPQPDVKIKNPLSEIICYLSTHTRPLEKNMSNYRYSCVTVCRSAAKWESHITCHPRAWRNAPFLKANAKRYFFFLCLKKLQNWLFAHLHASLFSQVDQKVSPAKTYKPQHRGLIGRKCSLSVRFSSHEPCSGWFVPVLF